MAASKKKGKKLTNREKALRKESKKRLQEKGIIPPDKKRLNRKKFAIEVLEIVHSEDFSWYEHLSDLINGFAAILPIYRNGKVAGKITEEQIGALKVLKIAIENKKFMDSKRAEGITEYEVKEWYDKVAKPVCDL